MGKLAGRIAVVTGASRGIGKACCIRMMEDGVEGLAMIARNQASLEKLKEELGGGDNILCIECDVSSLEQVEAAFAKIYEHFGRVDILVNNAGVTRDAMFHKMSLEQWNDVMNIDLNSVFYCTRQVFQSMRQQKYGKIVNLSSTSAFGNIGQTNYAAAKAAIQGFTRTLAREGGRNNITVNAVLPCFIETDIMSTIPADLQEANKKSIPMQRWGAPSELAAVVSFLSSDDSSYLSGQSIIVNGGALTL